jgi:predicted HTH domain antitoxin
MSEVLSVKVEREKLKQLEEIAKEEQSDRSAVARRLLDAGIRKWRVDKAVEAFRAGKVSLWKASVSAGVTLREFMGILEERKVVTVGVTAAEIEKEVEAMASEAD